MAGSRYLVRGLAREGENVSEIHTGRVAVAAHRTRTSRRARTAYPQGGPRFVTGVAVIVALATAAFGVQAYVRAGRDQSRIATLRSDLAMLRQRVAADEQGAASERVNIRSAQAQAKSARRALARFGWALQSVPSESQVAGVRSELAAYASCIPQLQSEIAGLTLHWRVDGAKPSGDYFKLSTAAPISASCARALTGH